ncbi:MAG: site-specific integrase, partial [Phycisphaerae bacterium]|nr:site-specific integrase [Phycisphaerae bacterium]
MKLKLLKLNLLKDINNMASLGCEKGKKGKTYYIQLSPGEHPRRPRIRLGKVTKRDAAIVLIHIENLIQAKKTGRPYPASTADWLVNVTDSIKERLEVIGLIAKRAVSKRYTVKEWFDAYIMSRPDVKDATRRKWHDVEAKLNSFFNGKYLDEITAQDAKGFRIYLRSTLNLSENTTRKHICISRQIFRAAVLKKLIEENPFAGQSVTVRANPARYFYVTPEIAKQVLDACPDAQWRLIFGLARFGGLRCPSEVLRLKWEDVDFEKEQFTVHASKTEHHADGGIRIVPMFPELKTLFRDAFEKAYVGAIYCIKDYREGANLGPQMRRIIKRAGILPWPKIFQNLRSTRETELFKLTEGNIKAVCEWIGNSPQVAMMHYAQVTEADMQEAARMTVMTEANAIVHNPAHNPAQNLAEHNCMELGLLVDEGYKSLLNRSLCERNKKPAVLCEPQEWAIQD